MLEWREEVDTETCWQREAEVHADRTRAASPRTLLQPATGQPLTHLIRTIEGEIIPRLLLAHRASTACPSLPTLAYVAPSLDEVAQLARLVLAHEATIAITYVEVIRRRGVSLETLYLDLLAPTARHLGDLWNEDLCDFTEVTMGLCRLHQVLHTFSQSFQNDAEYRQHSHRALLAPMAGEQHSFGLFMVVEFFRRAGWDVRGESAVPCKDLATLVRSEWFDVIGLSVSRENQLDQLAAEIRTLRRASCNRTLGVLVGGRIFNAHPEFTALVGADATASDGQQAAVQAERLLTLLTAR